MADSCSINMEARSPQSTFSSFAGKGQSCNYKKVLLSAYNGEENLQEPPKSPQIAKPMPPLEPLLDDLSVSHAFVTQHPKKRLKKDFDDPWIGEAAASPLSSSKPCSPMSLLSKIGDEGVSLRSPASDTRIHLESFHLFSGPNSPYSSLPSPLDTGFFSDSAYSSCSVLSPINSHSSPGSTTQATSPTEFFPSTTNTSIPKRPSPPQENTLHTLPPDKGKEDTLHQKHCPRPQSVALDLTSLQKPKSLSKYPVFRESSQQHQQVNPPTLSSLPTMLNDGPQMADVRKGFQYTIPNLGIISHTNNPQISPQNFNMPNGIAHSTVHPKNIYNHGGQQQVVVGTITSRQARVPRFYEGGGVIRPKPTHFYQKPLPNHLMHYHSQRGKLPMLHPPPGSQGKRMPSEMISYNQPRFQREMPDVALQPPTAITKKLSWLHGEDSVGSHQANATSIHNNDLQRKDESGFRHKPIHTWGHQDVIYYMFEAMTDLKIKIQDLNFSELSGTTGKDLCQMTMEDFKRFTPQTAELMYRHFMGKLNEEKRQQAAAHAASSHQESQNNRLGRESSHFEFINPSNNYFPTSHHNSSHPLQHLPNILMRESEGGCDAAAPYEFHYKTVDTRSIRLDDGNRELLPENLLPSASGKSFGPLHAPSPAAIFDMEGNMSDPDQSSNEEEVKPEPPKKRGPGRPRKPENELKKKKKKTGRLWEFIRNLLLNPETCPSMVRWENPEEGVFRFVQAEKVAQRWGERKNNKEMNYEKLSRAMRYYYKGQVFEAVLGRRLVYKFGKNAKNWRPTNPNFVNQGPHPHSSTH